MVYKNCATFGQKITFHLDDSLLALADEHFYRSGYDYEVQK
ncbi:hypothetical protein [Marinilactibacillus sp. Marseille-P9653]|nr:hypothetical protein [Marinilactibacillus sp. Marseille-P9653]